MPSSCHPFIARCKSLLGEQHVIDDSKQMLPYLTDARKRAVGKALAILLPGSTEEVSTVVRLCHEYLIPIVPQSGNTGTVLGSIPDTTGNAVVLSLKRMNHILEIDTDNNTMTVEAGCILDNVHIAARQVDRIFPLTLASSGSCMIGGNLAANAGGTAVLRYGTAHGLCLGIQVVLPDGAVWDGLYKLRKNNTGYDLRDLFIGSEGTLGIITAAVLKLFPNPDNQQTAFIAVENPSMALNLLNLAKKQADCLLTTFELMSQQSLDVVLKHFPDLKSPFPAISPYYVLMELSSNESEDHLADVMETILQTAFDEGCAVDACIAQSIAQSKTLWALRENISEAQARDGKNIKHDISVPISQIPAFMEDTATRLQAAFPGCRLTVFGHLGDGSLHYNVGAPEGISDDAFLVKQDEVNQVVYDNVARFNGAISAEHGLGALKHDKNAQYKDAVEIQLMKKIKQAFDPDGIMNPGKVIP